MRSTVRLLLFAVATCTAVATAVGCASTPDPPPPDLGEAMERTASRIQSLDFNEQLIENDLERLGELKSDLDLLIERIAVSELPLSLLRLVAMNCLNAEYDGHVTDVTGIDGVPLSCRPAHIDALMTSLENVSTVDRDDAYQLLYLVDQARILRGGLRQRVARLPRAAAEHRDYLADERASLRHVEAELQQRRNQYSSSGWQKANGVIEDYRTLLHELDRRIDAIVEIYPQWPARLDRTISEIYFGLSDLRR